MSWLLILSCGWICWAPLRIKTITPYLPWEPPPPSRVYRPKAQNWLGLEGQIITIQSLLCTLRCSFHLCWYISVTDAILYSKFGKLSPLLFKIAQNTDDILANLQENLQVKLLKIWHLHVKARSFVDLMNIIWRQVVNLKCENSMDLLMQYVFSYTRRQGLAERYMASD